MATKQLMPQEIKALRLRLGLTQQEMASRLHMATHTVARWELGKCKPTKAHVYRLQKMDRKKKEA